MSSALETALKRLARARRHTQEKEKAFKEDLRRMEPVPLEDEPLPKKPKAPERAWREGPLPSEAYGPQGPYWKDKDD